ncbi:hypothetical protein CTB91_01017 [Dickeya solani]|uniref:Uncharacterized protein n=1 Tax=Dickeya solani D s0432-1 TaxID=1231725 RepID=A0AAV3KAN8_9GAMM|nr:hypothetical protein CTB91_01017 [Dickeya solani]ERO57830.1 hypothetical protein A544_0997 [Dickeya solani D s0432-1]AYQ51020.1 hypothetical protein DSOL99_01023 [Dickeya solani]NUA39022.1 hypothetical protein [Dickeya solani]NUA45367.1 hypothetical protein [Dickeya solani]
MGMAPVRYHWQHSSVCVLTFIPDTAVMHGMVMNGQPSLP